MCALGACLDQVGNEKQKQKYFKLIENMKSIEKLQNNKREEGRKTTEKPSFYYYLNINKIIVFIPYSSGLGSTFSF